MKTTDLLRIFLLFCILVLLADSGITGQSQQRVPGKDGTEFPLPGEWGSYRRDGSQQARSSLKGNISDPTINWKHYVGTIQTLFEIKSGEEKRSFSVPLQDRKDLEKIWRSPRWNTVPPSRLIGGQKTPAIRTANVTYADIRPDIPGLESVEFESAFRGSGEQGQWPSSGAKALAWQDGRWQTLWQMPPIANLFTANPLIDDFDGDGKLDVAFLPWQDLVILDAETGRNKDSCRFTPGRSYGLFGAYDFNQDGRKEMLVVADFSKHVAVLGYVQGKLSVLWQRNIELDISNPQKTMRVHPDPVADLNSDGFAEVILNMHNESGDGKWHVSAHIGMDGEKVLDLPDEHLQGIADIDGDGAPELLTVVTQQNSIPEFGTIRIWTWKDDEASILWECENAGWETWLRPMPLHVNTQATDALRDVLWRGCTGGPYVVVRRPAAHDQITLSARTWRHDTLRSMLSVTGAGIHAVALDEEGAMLVACETQPDTSAILSCTGNDLKIHASGRMPAFPGSPVVVHDQSDTPPLIIAQGRGQQLVGFRAPSGVHPATELWRINGRSQTVAWPDCRYGLVAADLNNDGKRQVLYAAKAPSGCARIIAAHLDGEELWHHDFPGIPGDPPIWNVGGLILWQVGYCTKPNRMDVVVTIRRSMMHSEETVLLSGRDGREIWHRRRQIMERGVGGTPFAIADFNSDGMDDIASLHPNVYYILEGQSGKNMMGTEVDYWGLPIAGDFLNNGTKSVFFGTERSSLTGVLKADGAMIWSDAPGHSAGYPPAFGDFTGRRRMEAIAVGYPDGIRCYDTSTGRIHWNIPLPGEGTVAGTASADIDSDGYDEALITIGNTIFCIGSERDGNTGRVEWELSLPCTLGAPVVAQIGKSASAEILVPGQDGYIYCLAGK